MEAGTEPPNARVRKLTSRWMELLGEFTGGDSGIPRSLENMWRHEDEVHGFDARVMRRLGEYVSRALRE